MSSEEQVLISKLARGDPVRYVKAVASQIVSLTDLRAFQIAEQLGRGLLNWIDQDFRGGKQTEIQCRMIACGAMGGQPVLNLALEDRRRAEESLKLLQTTLDHAYELNESSEIARDLVQIALWHALLKPGTCQTQCARAEEGLKALAVQDTRVAAPAWLSSLA